MLYISSRTVESRNNEVSRYQENVRYSKDPATTNYLANNKNIRYGGVTKLNQAEQCDIHHAKQSTDLRVNGNS